MKIITIAKLKYISLYLSVFHGRWKKNKHWTKSLREKTNINKTMKNLTIACKHNNDKTFKKGTLV